MVLEQAMQKPETVNAMFPLWNAKPAQGLFTLITTRISVNRP